MHSLVQIIYGYSLNETFALGSLNPLLFNCRVIGKLPAFFNTLANALRPLLDLDCYAFDPNSLLSKHLFCSLMDDPLPSLVIDSLL
jgi:hypothetical protein